MYDKENSNDEWISEDSEPQFAIDIEKRRS